MTRAETADSYPALRRAVAALAVLLERYPDVDLDDVEVYDNEGPTVVVTPSDPTPATAERIRADLGLRDHNRYGEFPGFYGGKVADLDDVWVSVNLPARRPSKVRTLLVTLRYRKLLVGGLLGAGFTAGWVVKRATGTGGAR